LEQVNSKVTKAKNREKEKRQYRAPLLNNKPYHQTQMEMILNAKIDKEESEIEQSIQYVKALLRCSFGTSPENAKPPTPNGAGLAL
jgi:hypothetical protein